MFMLSGEAAQARAAYAKLEVRPRSAKARTEVQGEDGVRLLCHAIAAAAQGDQGGKDKGIGREAQRCLQRCLLYTSPSPRDATLSRMPSSA